MGKVKSSKGLFSLYKKGDNVVRINKVGRHMFVLLRMASAINLQNRLSWVILFLIDPLKRYTPSSFNL